MIEKTEVYNVEITGAYFDNLKAYDYEDFDPEDVAENSEGIAEDYKKKAAAHVKFNQMCMNLQKGLNDIKDLEATGGDHLTIPTSMKFKLVYTQPDGLTVEVDESEYVEGDDEIIKIHFHTNEPWKVLEYCSTLGEIYDIVVEDMDRQSRGLKG